MTDHGSCVGTPEVTPPIATPDASRSRLSRRKFLGSVGGAAAAAAAGGGILALSPALARRADAQEAPAGSAAGLGGPAAPTAVTGETASTISRHAASYRMRTSVARSEFLIPPQANVANGDEQRYPNFLGNYHKALPHNSSGEVEADAYGRLLSALASGDPADFESIPLGGTTKLTDPQSGLAFDLQGADGQALAIPPAPALASAEAAGEMVELYWAALLRDVNFGDYPAHPDVAAACADLNSLTDFRGPRRQGKVTPQTLFRDVLTGCNVGPYLSQFLLLPAPFGAEYVQRQIRTFLPGTDRLTGFDEWLNVQNGGKPAGAVQFDPQRRFLRNARDLSAWVHKDVLFQAYFDACLILISPPDASEAESGGLGCPLNPGNPYLHSKTQAGFGTFGPPGIKGCMCEVATRGLKTTWHKKWYVHRRLRPEAFGGLVHLQQTASRYPGLLHHDVLGSPVLDRLQAKFGSFLHPAAFPEGCPTHPSYSAGHATVAGACVTVLKAVFDETFVIQDPVVPSADGLSLEPYRGSATLTVGGELNKLASNIATGRNLAGVHWRSDALESLLIGEAMAISMLADQRPTYNENRGGFFSGYTFTRFNGTRVSV
ncbi:MAG TPA: vanadium-dependent haloperoxidase [Thermoanaerobaculia bacterium]|nr:vanadium-dependent haloperoxidase [Thermoanaerobaculia bacterium]